MNRCLCIAALLVTSCHTNTSSVAPADKDSVILNYATIPSERKSVNPNAVKTYRETGKNADELLVSIFETKERFHYRVKIDYNGLKGEDTLRVPNFGIEPDIEIVKGDKRPSCIIGFFDKDKKFRESKLIYFENNKLKIHVLKRYAVATYQDTLK